MKTLLKVFLLSLLALAVSSCGRGYNMHLSGPYDYSSTRVYERMFHPAGYDGPYPAYSPSTYAGANSNHYYGGMGGWMH